MLSTQHTNLVPRAPEVVLQKVQNQLDVIIVRVEEKFELIRDFLLYNKLVLNVVDTVRWLMILAINAAVTVKFNQMKMLP